MSKTTGPTKRAPLDVAVAFSLQFGRQRPRATQAGCSADSSGACC